LRLQYSRRPKDGRALACFQIWEELN